MIEKKADRYPSRDEIFVAIVKLIHMIIPKAPRGITMSTRLRETIGMSNDDIMLISDELGWDNFILRTMKSDQVGSVRTVEDLVTFVEQNLFIALPAQKRAKNVTQKVKYVLMWKSRSSYDTYATGRNTFEEIEAKSKIDAIRKALEKLSTVAGVQHAFLQEVRSDRIDLTKHVQLYRNAKEVNKNKQSLDQTEARLRAQASKLLADIRLLDAPFPIDEIPESLIAEDEEPPKP